MVNSVIKCPSCGQIDPVRYIDGKQRCKSCGREGSGWIEEHRLDWNGNDTDSYTEILVCPSCGQEDPARFIDGKQRCKSCGREGTSWSVKSVLNHNAINAAQQQEAQEQAAFLEKRIRELSESSHPLDPGTITCPNCGRKDYKNHELVDDTSATTCTSCKASVEGRFFKITDSFGETQHKENYLNNVKGSFVEAEGSFKKAVREIVDEALSTYNMKVAAVPLSDPQRQHQRLTKFVDNYRLVTPLEIWESVKLPNGTDGNDDKARQYIATKLLLETYYYSPETITDPETNPDAKAVLSSEKGLSFWIKVIAVIIGSYFLIKNFF